MKTLTIYLSDGETLSQWAVKQANYMLNDRYRLVHLSKDMTAPYHTVRRFVAGHNVALKIQDKFISLYLSHVYGNYPDPDSMVAHRI
jgi:hypothetical protein